MSQLVLLDVCVSNHTVTPGSAAQSLDSDLNVMEVQCQMF